MNLICKGLPILIILISLSVLVGWSQGDKLLKSWLPERISMHYSTAICFILTSISMLILSRNKINKGYLYVATSFVSSIVIFIMGGQFLSAYFSDLIKFHIGGVVSDESSQVVNGIPSLGTITLFCMFNLRCLMILSESSMEKMAHNLFLWITLSGIVSAIFGHIFDIPALYFYYPNSSSGMAANTTFCFFLLWLVFKCNKNLNERMFLEEKS